MQLIGKFRDVGELVGVNRFNQAGGAIVDDFDIDGLLDIVLTSFDATLAMAYYHNQGTEPFLDRSREARWWRARGSSSRVRSQVRPRAASDDSHKIFGHLAMPRPRGVCWLGQRSTKTAIYAFPFHE
jgi:hypothetical protein